MNSVAATYTELVVRHSSLQSLFAVRSCIYLSAATYPRRKRIRNKYISSENPYAGRFSPCANSHALLRHEENSLNKEHR